MKIISNHHWRPFKYRNEVPKTILKTQFDWLDEDTIDGFLKYRGTWYHTSQFLKNGIPDWDGSLGHNYFSGVVINLADDRESYQIGTFLQ